MSDTQKTGPVTLKLSSAESSMVFKCRMIDELHEDNARKEVIIGLAQEEAKVVRLERDVAIKERDCAREEASKYTGLFTEWSQAMLDFAGLQAGNCAQVSAALLTKIAGLNYRTAVAETELAELKKRRARKCH
jgi:hypothetical protein